MIPIVRASENPRKTSPPNRTIASTDKKTNHEEMNERESVWLIESFVTL